MTLRGAVRTLAVLALALPLGQTVLGWAASLLRAAGDEPAAAVVRHLATAAAVAWLACLAGLVVVLALESLAQRDRDPLALPPPPFEPEE